jgi:zinc D-Ala-D-Ala carboxypeptidase
MNLSKHFKLEEFTKSQLSVRHGIINKPGSGEIKNLENLCYEILEPVRAHFDKPINNVDFDQCILEFYKPNDGQAGWIHVAYKEGNNRKQVLTYDGNSYTNGLPDMKWEKGVVVE